MYANPLTYRITTPESDPWWRSAEAQGPFFRGSGHEVFLGL